MYNNNSSKNDQKSKAPVGNDQQNGGQVGFKLFASVRRASESPLKQSEHLDKAELYNSVREQNSDENVKEDAKMNQTQKLEHDSNAQSNFFCLKKAMLNKENLNASSDNPNLNAAHRDFLCKSNEPLNNNPSS